MSEITTSLGTATTLFGVVTTLIVAVNISFPIAVLTGIVGLK